MTSAWVKKLQTLIADANEKKKLIDEKSTESIKNTYLPQSRNQKESNSYNKEITWYKFINLSKSDCDIL